MTHPTSPHGSGGTSPAKRKQPSPLEREIANRLPLVGEIVRDGLTGEEVAIKAEDQAVLKQFNEHIWKEYGEARKIGYVLGAYFNAMSESRLYLAAGFQYEKEFYEEEYSEIGRATIMRLRKIARAFGLRVSLRETRKNLALPEFCSLEQKKLEMLARLPEEMRNALKEKGKITISKGTYSRIVSLDELRTMSREEVQMLVGIALDDPIGGSRRGEGIREYLCEMSPEAAKILELIFRRRDMMIGLVTKFERLGEEQWTKVQRKRVAEELRGICDVLLRKARKIDPTKGPKAFGKKNPSLRSASPRQGEKRDILKAKCSFVIKAVFPGETTHRCDDQPYVFDKKNGGEPRCGEHCDLSNFTVPRIRENARHARAAKKKEIEKRKREMDKKKNK